MEPGRIEAVVLDLGGVLVGVDFSRTLSHWAHAANRDPADLANHAIADVSYERHERGEIDFTDFAQAVRHRLGIEIDDDTLREGWNLALGDALPGAAMLAQAIAARWPLHLFSNTNATHHAHWSAEHAALLEGFGHVFVSHEIGLRKPDPAAFAQIAETIGLDAGGIVFFDDLTENVRGAHAAGLMAGHAQGPAAVAAHLGLELRHD